MVAQFTLRLICGMSLMWCLMPRSQVTTGFFRIQMLVVLALSVLVTLTVGSGFSTATQGEVLLSSRATASLCIAMACLAYAGSVVWTLGWRRSGNAFVFLIAAMAAGTVIASNCVSSWTGSLADWLRPVSAVASSAVIGGAVTGMLLGHWYLTAPTMSIAPLGRMNSMFGVSAIVRMLVSLAGLWLIGGQIGDSTQVVWLALRWLGGVFAPIAAVIAVSRILRYRNTQSATGVLFAAVILVFLGEFSALLLESELRLPV